MNNFFEVVFTQNPPGHSSWNKSWKSTYKKGNTLYACRSAVSGTYLIWNGSHHFGTLNLTEEQAKNCCKAIRINGKIAYVDAKTQRRLEKDYNWMISS